MAILNLSITIPDAQLPRIQSAVRAEWGQGLTNAEIVERLRQEVIVMIRSLTISRERAAAVVPSLDAT